MAGGGPRGTRHGHQGGDHQRGAADPGAEGEGHRDPGRAGQRRDGFHRERRQLPLRRRPGPEPARGTGPGGRGSRTGHRVRRLMAGPVFLADTSAYVAQARDSDARARFAGLLTEGRLAVCQMTALEYLNNAPDPQAYEVLWTALQGQRRMDVTATAMNRAMEVHRMLAENRQPRNFRLTDLIIAATAEEHGATV